MKNLQQRESKLVFSFFGPPGSGKGTLAEKLKTELGFSVLSTGNLCRFHIAQKTNFGQQLNDFVSRGHLIPDDLISSMVVEWLIVEMQKGNPVILDGFPRTAAQATALLSYLKNQKCAFRVIFVELADEEIVKRLSNRKVCNNKSCQAIYNTAYTKNECAICGALLVKRDDDQEHVVRERLKIYPSYKDSLLQMYKDLSISVEELNVGSMSIQEVFNTFKLML